MKAIIPAAGLGTRFLPATKAVPKEMLPVLDKPTIQYIVEEALAAEADEVVIVNSRNKPSIEAHFAADETLAELLDNTGKPELAVAIRHAGSLPVSYVIQEEQLGLGHAVHCAYEKVLAGATENSDISQLDPFYVLLGDVIVPDNNMLPRMLEISKSHGGASVIAVIPVTIEETRRFGVIAGEDLGNAGEPDVWRISALVEKPQQDPPSNLAIFGRYLLSAKTMQILATTKPGAGGEIQLTDAMVELLETEEMYALVIKEDDGYDVGTISNWLMANNKMAAKQV
jgi:UTP--glucose-1-phosphate uridylyltransferase